MIERWKLNENICIRRIQHRRVACISEDINMIRKKMCDKTYFDPQYNDYPILTIWENGDSIEKIEGGNVLKKIAEEINKL